MPRTAARSGIINTGTLGMGRTGLGTTGNALLRRQEVTVTVVELFEIDATGAPRCQSFLRCLEATVGIQELGEALLMTPLRQQ